MMVRGRLDLGLEKPEEEREQGWVIRHHERTSQTRTRPEVRRRTRLKGVRYPRHIDRPAVRSRTFGGQGRPDPRTVDRRLGVILKMPPLVNKDQNSVTKEDKPLMSER